MLLERNIHINVWAVSDDGHQLVGINAGSLNKAKACATRMGYSRIKIEEVFFFELTELGAVHTEYQKVNKKWIKVDRPVEFDDNLFKPKQSK